MHRLLCMFVLATVTWNCCSSAPTEEPKRPKLFDDEILLSPDFVTTQPEVNSTEISILKGWVYERNETGSREKRTLKRRGCRRCGGGFIIPLVIFKKVVPIQSGCHGCSSGCRGGCGGGGGGGFSYSSSQSSSSSMSWGRK